MEELLAVLAATAATGLLVDLVRSYRRRPRPHVGAWALAISLYAIATWALAVGLVAGWSSPVFRLFYGFGAILNVPFLGIGSAYLVLGERAGRRLLEWFSLAGAFALFITFTAPFVAPLPGDGLPAGSDVFADIGTAGPTGPRFYALLFNVVGTLLLVGLAGWSAVRFWRTNRRLVAGNVLIVLGGLFPAFGGSLFAIGETSAFALSLLFGAVLLWAGFRVASSARR
jgi:hypothetical protein